MAQGDLFYILSSPQAADMLDALRPGFAPGEDMELMTTVMRLHQRLPREQVGDLLRPFASRFGTIMEIPQARALLLRDTRARVRKMQEVLESVLALETRWDVELLPLHQAQAGVAAGKVVQLYEALASRGHLAEIPVILPVEWSNSLLVAGSEEQRHAVRGVLDNLDRITDSETDMSDNTTTHLLADMEQLREFLDVERWLLFGGSWGSTLILAYAQRYPDRVSELVLSPVTTTRRSEIDWLYGGVSRFFPDAWERFRAGAAEAGNDDNPGGGRGIDIVAPYARLMNDPDPEVRMQAANAWCAWEDTLISHEGDEKADIYSSRPRDAKLAFVRIASHYFAHGAWLEEEELLRNADRLDGIPGVLIHGRLDLAGPLETAWELDRTWTDAELVVVDDSGHTGNERVSAQKRGALDTFAHR